MMHREGARHLTAKMHQRARTLQPCPRVKPVTMVCAQAVGHAPFVLDAQLPAPSLSCSLASRRRLSLAHARCLRTLSIACDTPRARYLSIQNGSRVTPETCIVANRPLSGPIRPAALHPPAAHPPLPSRRVPPALLLPPLRLLPTPLLLHILLLPPQSPHTPRLVAHPRPACRATRHTNDAALARSQYALRARPTFHPSPQPRAL